MTRCGNDPRVVMTPKDTATMQAFRNFLSWNVQPALPPFPVPPAWFAYAWGLTQYCPPEGEM